MAPIPEGGLSSLEYHVLLAVAEGPLHGYAIRDAVEAESQGVLTPRAGSLYRVIARLTTAGLVVEKDADPSAEPHPGRPRRYYELAARGRSALADETARLKAATALADDRLRVRRS
jgi:DNA-binding PadR family transcriptional regulator